MTARREDAFQATLSFAAWGGPCGGNVRSSTASDAHSSLPGEGAAVVECRAHPADPSAESPLPASASG